MEAERAEPDTVELATVVDRPRRVSGPHPAEPDPSSSTIHSPLDALQHDEIQRTRRFCLLGMTITAAGAAFAPFLPGDRTAMIILYVAIVVAVAGMAYLYHLTTRPERFHGTRLALGWYIPSVAAAMVMPYFGVFSSAPIVLVLGIYFTGLGSQRHLSLAIYLTCAVVQGGFAALVIAGVLDDPGLVHADYRSTSAQIIIQCLIQQVLLLTYLIARISRRTALAAVGELERAVRAVSQREALLAEARQDLERALRGGRVGRFTEQSLGPYRLGAVIGRGAVGEVYEATHVETGEAAAVKLLSAASLGNPLHVRRFLRELHTAAAVQSPHVVRVLEVGEEPVPYLAMERLRGTDLAELLRARRTLPPAEVVQLVREIGEALTAAAAAGVVHRDLKPQNVFRHQGTWKVLDFGVSRLATGAGTLTVGHVVGTPAYMAPEQARDHAVDHRADLYALAAIAYRALTGRPPFGGRDVADTIYRVVHTMPARPGAFVDLHADVDAVLAIGLAKEPAARFASASELADAFARAVAGDLPAALRERAAALVRTAPWST